MGSNKTKSGIKGKRGKTVSFPSSFALCITKICIFCDSGEEELSSERGELFNMKRGMKQQMREHILVYDS